MILSIHIYTTCLSNHFAQRTCIRARPKTFFPSHCVGSQILGSPQLLVSPRRYFTIFYMFYMLYRSSIVKLCQVVNEIIYKSCFKLFQYAWIHIALSYFLTSQGERSFSAAVWITWSKIRFQKPFLRLGLTGVLTFAQVTLGKANPPNVVGRSCLAARSVAKGSTNQVAKGSGFYDWKTFRTFRSPVHSYYEFLRGHGQPRGIDKALALPALDLAVKGCWLIFHQGKPANPQRKHRHH